MRLRGKIISYLDDLSKTTQLHSSNKVYEHQDSQTVFALIMSWTESSPAFMQQVLWGSLWRAVFAHGTSTLSLSCCYCASQ